MPGRASLVVAATALSIVPLLAAMLLLALPGLLPIDGAVVERVVVAYAALLLSFLGGVRWGIRIGGRAGTDMIYLLGALGPALGLVVLLLPFSPALALLTVGFAAQGAWDVWSGLGKSVPETYARHRSVATLMICVALIAILFLQVMRG
jgi:hypothetical protein